MIWKKCTSILHILEWREKMYSDIIGSFLKSLRALKFYVSSVEPVICNEIVDVNDENDHIELARFLKTVMKAKEVGYNFEDIDSFKITVDDEEISKRNKQMAHELIKTVSSLIIEKKVDGNIMYSYKQLPREVKEKYQEIESQEKQSQILYSGSLMLLITYLENLISKVFKRDFIKHPQRIALDSKSVTYKLLEQMGDVNEIKNHLIDEEVTSMMFKSFSDWITYLKKNLKLDLKFVNDNFNEIIEIISRRNLFVHNDGKVNSIYLKNTNIDSKYKKGDDIQIDRGYIDNAITLIESTGITIIIELWLKEYGCEDEEVDKVVSFIYDEYMIHEKWEMAVSLYEICLNYKKLNIANTLTIKLNRWQCYKWLGNYIQIKGELESVDLSAYSPRYKLGFFALKEMYDEFFILYEEQNDIGEMELSEWPIFRELRECNQYRVRFTDCKTNETSEYEAQNENNKEK